MEDGSGSDAEEQATESSSDDKDDKGEDQQEEQKQGQKEQETKDEQKQAKPDKSDKSSDDSSDGSSQPSSSSDGAKGTEGGTQGKSQDDVKGPERSAKNTTDGEPPSAVSNKVPSPFKCAARSQGLAVPQIMCLLCSGTTASAPGLCSLSGGSKFGCMPYELAAYPQSSLTHLVTPSSDFLAYSVR